MKSATTASTEMPQPAIAIPVWPVGTNSLLMPRLRASRSSSSETVIFPIAQSEPTVRTVRAGSSRFAPGRDVQPLRRLAQVAQRRRRGARRAAPAPGRRSMNSCSPFSTSSPARDRVAQQLAPLGREAPARGRDADERGRRLEAERLVDRADDREAALGLPRPLRVEQRDDVAPAGSA